jgi:hypothetical protein
MNVLKQREFPMMLVLLQDSLRMRELTYFKLFHLLEDLRCMRRILMLTWSR